MQNDRGEDGEEILINTCKERMIENKAGDREEQRKVCIDRPTEAEKGTEAKT